MTFRNIIRNKYLSLSTVFTGLVLSFFLFIVLGVGAALTQGVNDLKQDVDITVFLSPGISKENSLLRDLSGRVEGLGATTQVLSGEEALAKLQQSSSVPELIQDTVSFIEDYEGESIFQGTLVLSNLSVGSVDNVVRVLQDPIYEPLVDFSYFEEQVQRVKSFSSTTFVSQSIFLGIVLVLFVTMLLVIFNVTRLLLFSRKREIEVMQLVGANRRTISFPFYAEMLILTSAGVVFSFVLFLLLTGQLGLLFKATSSGVESSNYMFSEVLGAMYGHFSVWGVFELLKVLLLFIAASALSVWFALKTYLFTK